MLADAGGCWLRRLLRRIVTKVRRFLRRLRATRGSPLQVGFCGH
jgi:hypothetical protein